MRFAICNETFQEWPLARAMRFAGECGYEGIEFAPFTLGSEAGAVPTEKRREICRLAKTCGLEVVGLHWLLAKTSGYHLTSPEKLVRERTAAYLRDLVRLCADLGGKIMVFGSPQQRNILPSVSPQLAIDYAVEVFRSIGPDLQAADVTLALEPLGPEETNFLQTAEETVDLIDLIGCDQFRLLLDCKAMSTEKHPIRDLIDRYQPWLAHFHANDPNRQGPGFGNLDFKSVFKALSRVEYAGWVSVEVFDYSPGVERLAKESLRYMERCLEQI